MDLLRENLLPLLSLIIALSAYLATGRSRLLDRLRDLSKDRKEGGGQPNGSRGELKSHLMRLLWAEVPLVLSGLWLLGCWLWTALSIWERWPVFENIGFGTFAFAAVALALFHVGEWKKTLRAK